jgi:hypothetical protein
MMRNAGRVCLQESCPLVMRRRRFSGRARRLVFEEDQAQHIFQDPPFCFLREVLLRIQAMDAGNGLLRTANVSPDCFALRRVKMPEPFTPFQNVSLTGLVLLPMCVMLATIVP